MGFTNGPCEDKEWRYQICVDYRKLNELTKKDSCPLLRVDTTIDLKSGNWQVELEEQDRKKTASTTGNGLWQFNMMAFSLCNAPATFERSMDNILDDLRCLVYLDDMIV